MLKKCWNMDLVRRGLCILLVLSMLLSFGPLVQGTSVLQTEPATYTVEEAEARSGLLGVLERIIEALAASFFQRLADELSVDREAYEAELGATEVPELERVDGTFLQFFPDYSFALAVAEAFPGRTVHCFVTAEELADLTGVLEANRREIWSIQGAQYLTHVTRLILCDNEISDVRYLLGLSNLLYLHLAGNPVEHVEVLAGLSNLRELHLDGGTI